MPESRDAQRRDTRSDVPWIDPPGRRAAREAAIQQATRIVNAPGSVFARASAASKVPPLPKREAE